MKGIDHVKQLKIGMSYIKCLNSNYFSFGNKGPFRLNESLRNAFDAFSYKIKLILEIIGQVGIEQFESLELNFKNSSQ